MGTGEKILIVLSGYAERYRTIERDIHGGGPASFVKLKECIGARPNTLRVTLSRLKRNGLVVNQSGKWLLTPVGQKIVKGGIITKILRRFSHGVYAPKSRSKSKKMIVVFDVPERERRHRDWLRIELAMMGFTQLQKSVWFGPAPLPKAFIRTVSDADMLQYMKFFRASKHEIV
ncbi:hypothetical protein HY967_00105 [Candidatus Jorgensenbacteria bacterium]|nr:hypothetical protein [Candidatus Jorgensenbacteria bacterium]